MLFYKKNFLQKYALNNRLKRFELYASILLMKIMRIILNGNIFYKKSIIIKMNDD